MAHYDHRTRRKGVCPVDVTTDENEGSRTNAQSGRMRRMELLRDMGSNRTPPIVETQQHASSASDTSNGISGGC